MRFHAGAVVASAVALFCSTGWNREAMTKMVQARNRRKGITNVTIA